MKVQLPSSANFRRAKKNLFPQRSWLLHVLTKASFLMVVILQDAEKIKETWWLIFHVWCSSEIRFFNLFSFLCPLHFWQHYLQISPLQWIYLPFVSPTQREWTIERQFFSHHTVFLHELVQSFISWDNSVSRLFVLVATNFKGMAISIRLSRKCIVWTRQDVLRYHVCGAFLIKLDSTKSTSLTDKLLHH